jgi:predicted nuclease with RNAse H fold
MPAEQIWALLSMIPGFMLNFINEMIAIKGSAPAIPEKFEKNAVNVYTTHPPTSDARIGVMPECLHFFVSEQNSYSARQSSLDWHF